MTLQCSRAIAHYTNWNRNQIWALFKHTYVGARAQSEKTAQNHQTLFPPFEGGAWGWDYRISYYKLTLIVKMRSVDKATRRYICVGWWFLRHSDVSLLCVWASNLTICVYPSSPKPPYTVAFVWKYQRFISVWSLMNTLLDGLTFSVHLVYMHYK